MSRVCLVGVSRTFGTNVALHPTDLEVAEGEFLTLLGPSGCGKTTTLRMVAGFVAPSTGRVLIGEDDVTRLPPNRRQIGMVFQDYALFPHLTVAENVAFALRERRVQQHAVQARVTELLELIHLPEIAARYPAQLSGGQQQRVALARAIAHPPRVLLMDEPLSALDLKLRESMQAELRRIQRTLGITTIFVTHDQAEAMSLSDTIAVMSHGRVVQRGTAQVIYDQPANRFVAGFVGQINLLPAIVLGDGNAVRVLDQELPVPPTAPGQATLGVRPHDISFVATGLPGRVLSSRFGGNVWHTRVQVGDAEWLVETRPGTAMPAEDSVVALAWPPGRTMVLRD